LNAPNVPVLSPCVNICILDSAGQYCTGCYRSIDEIASWGTYSDDEKRAALARCDERLEAAFDLDANSTLGA